jgi:RNA polymerase sigma-70 factor (ECF subfamily)
MTQVDASLSDSIDLPEYALRGEVSGPQPGSLLSQEERRLLERLRAGDEAAFTSLVDRHHASMLRLALAHVSDRSVAEEVVQDAWMAVLEGLDRFEGRSSLKTWIYRILTNKAKTRGVRESRHTTFSSLGPADEEGDEPAVDPSCFRTSGHWSDYWASYPQPWDEATPEKLLLSKEGTGYLEQAIAALPPNLRQVVVLRDIEGLDSKDVCVMLGISEGNQRVLLHRGRARVRRALERYVEGGCKPA